MRSQLWFTEVMIVEEGSLCGNEPMLYDILIHYYTSHDIELSKARKFANEYIRAIEQRYPELTSKGFTK